MVNKPSDIVLDGQQLKSENSEACSIANEDRLDEFSNQNSVDILFPYSSDSRSIELCGNEILLIDFVNRLDHLADDSESIISESPTQEVQNVPTQITNIVPVPKIDQENCTNLKENQYITSFDLFMKNDGTGIINMILDPYVSLNLTSFINTASEMTGYQPGEFEKPEDYLVAVSQGIWPESNYGNTNGEVITKPGGELTFSIINNKVVLRGVEEQELIELFPCDFTKAVSSSLSFKNNEEFEKWKEYEYPWWRDPAILYPRLFWGIGVGVVGLAAATLAVMGVAGMISDTDSEDREAKHRKKYYDRRGMSERGIKVVVQKGFPLPNGEDGETYPARGTTIIHMDPQEFQHRKSEFPCYYPSLDAWADREKMGKDGIIVMPNVGTDLGSALNVIPDDVSKSPLLVRMFGNRKENEYLKTKVQKELYEEDGINEVATSIRREEKLFERVVGRIKREEHLSKSGRKLPLLDKALQREDIKEIALREIVREKNEVGLARVEIDMDKLSELYKARCVDNKFGPENEIHFQGREGVFYWRW